MPIVLRFSPLLTKVAAVPPLVLAPLVIAIVTLSALSGNLDIADLTVMVVFSALGIFMKAYAWPRPPILIAVVLAGPLETFMSRAIQTEGIGMVTRIPFLTILVVVVVAVFFSLRVQHGAQRLQEQTLAKEAAGGAES